MPDYSHHISPRAYLDLLLGHRYDFAWQRVVGDCRGSPVLLDRIQKVDGVRMLTMSDAVMMSRRIRTLNAGRSGDEDRGERRHDCIQRHDSTVRSVNRSKVELRIGGHPKLCLT